MSESTQVQTETQTLTLVIDKAPYHGREEGVRLAVLPKWFDEPDFRICVYADEDARAEETLLTAWTFGRARTRDSEFESRLSDGRIWLIRDSADKFVELLQAQLKLGRALTLVADIKDNYDSHSAAFNIDGDLFGDHMEVAAH